MVGVLQPASAPFVRLLTLREFCVATQLVLKRRRRLLVSSTTFCGSCAIFDVLILLYVMRSISMGMASFLELADSERWRCS